MAACSRLCKLQHGADTAVRLYKEACEVEVLATSDCHSLLIEVCSDAGRWLQIVADAAVNKDHQGAPASVCSHRRLAYWMSVVVPQHVAFLRPSLCFSGT